MPLPTGPRWLQQNAPLLLGALLLLAVCASLAWQTADWLRLLRVPATASIADSDAVLERPALERLEPLFGPAPANAGGATPATSLNLTLHGSFVNADPAKSSAIIQKAGDQPRRYLIGAKLDDATRLHAVYRDRVELERNGRIEQLVFPVQRENPSTSQTSRGNAQTDASDFDDLQQSNDELLQRRMEALREQMEAASEQEAHPTEQEPESD